MENPVINIDAKGQRTRLQGGVVGLFVGFAAAAGFLWSGINRWWRLLLFLPFWLGFLGVFQAREKT